MKKFLFFRRKFPAFLNPSVNTPICSKTSPSGKIAARRKSRDPVEPCAAVLCQLKHPFHSPNSLWKTLVDNHVDNVENTCFSTVIRHRQFSPGQPKMLHKPLHIRILLRLFGELRHRSEGAGRKEFWCEWFQFVGKFPVPPAGSPGDGRRFL